jgi:hypothetical protein
MRIRWVLGVLLLASATALADAGTGAFMGYQLGGMYPRGPATRSEETTTGNRVIVAEQAVKPADIAEVTLLATPATLTIGSISASQWHATEREARAAGRRYFELLRARYPAWAFGREVMDARMNIVEVSFDEPPYTLVLRIAEDRHDGKAMWRFSMSLGWMPDSAQDRAWREQSVREQGLAKQDAGRQLLEKADLRGL